MSEPLSAREAAARLRVSLRTLSRYVERGLLTPSYTPGGERRFDPAAVDELLTPPAPRPTELPADPTD